MSYLEKVAHFECNQFIKKVLAFAGFNISF